VQQARQQQEALAAAPHQLKALGLAFRAYVMAASAAPGTLAAAVATALAQKYKAYVDPAAVVAPAVPAAANEALAAGGAGARAAPQRAAPLLALAGAAVCFGAAGMLAQQAHVQELRQACKAGCQLLLVCPAGLTLPQLLRQAEAGSAGSADEPGLEAGELEYLEAAWEGRTQLSGSSSLEHSSKAVVAHLAARLGPPDAVLALLPDEAVRKLATAEGRHGRQPDLAHLNQAGISQLRMDLGSRAAGQAPQVAEAVCAMLAGNTSIRTLQLKGGRPLWHVATSLACLEDDG
jgi:hypothetical protein